MILRKTLITIYFWFWVVIGIITGMIVIIPGWLFNASQAWCRAWIEIILAGIPYKMMVWAGFWKVEWIDNRIDVEHDMENNHIPCVMVSNHLSACDSIFTALLPFDKIYTWKKIWSYVPGFGWLCLMGGHITIDTSSTTSKQLAIEKTTNHLQNDKTVLFYAKGTRNRNPKRLLHFKTGAFRVAKKASIPIVPITLIGTYDACCRGICDYADIKIVIDEYVDSGDIISTKNKVRDIIQYNISEYYKTN